MPPKGSQKSKKVEAPALAAPPKKRGKPPAPAVVKKKEPVVMHQLEREATIPVDVLYDSSQAKIAKLNRQGSYVHTLKLEAPNSFSLVKSVVFTEGPYEGHQAILIRPSKAFPFLELPKEVRTRIYGIYFAPGGLVNGEIVLEGKRTGEQKEVYAKSYANGSRNRVALLAVNKEIHEEAIQIFYAHAIKLESTTTLLDFLSQLPVTARRRLHSIVIKSWVKTTSRNAMNFLAESSGLQSLYIEGGVTTDGDATKVAKAFYADAYKFLEAVTAAKGNKEAGVDVLSFGPKAFQAKDDNKKLQPWEEETVEEFKDNLKAKLR